MKTVREIVNSCKNVSVLIAITTIWIAFDLVPSVPKNKLNKWFSPKNWFLILTLTHKNVAESLSNFILFTSSKWPDQCKSLQKAKERLRRFEFSCHKTEIDFFLSQNVSMREELSKQRTVSRFSCSSGNCTGFSDDVCVSEETPRHFPPSWVQV